MEEAKLAGSAFYYRWEVFDRQKGRKVPIEGESIDMSMCLARNFGNDVVDVDVTETLSHYLFKGVFIDLETGFTAPRLFRQRKKQSISEKMDAERQEDIVFQIGQSKAIRNAIVRAMPKWLRDQMIDAAKGSELSKIKPENIHIARAKVMDFFGKYGITQDRIENERNKKADEWGPQDIVDLRGMATAVKEGRISPDELFPLIPAEKLQDASQSTNGEGKEESTGGEETPLTPTGIKERYRQEWVNLKSAGFSTYIHKNFTRIETNGKTWPDLYKEMKEKWAKLYPNNPWPLVEKGDEPPVTEIVDNGKEIITEKERRLKAICGYRDELGLPAFNQILMTPPFNVKSLEDLPEMQLEDLESACNRKLDEAAG